MTEYLFIRLNDDDEVVASVVLDSNGRIIRPELRGPLEALQADAAGRRVVVLVPASDVMITDVAMPRAGPARVRQMLPFSLEESLAADIDSLHFAAGEWLDSDRVAAAVVAKRAIETWRSRLEQAGLHANAMYAISEGVPDTPATLNLVLEGGCTLGRRPGRPPFALEALTLAEIVTMLESQQEDKTDLQHAFVYLDEAALGTRQAELAALKTRAASVDTKVGDSLLARLGASLVFAPGTNLLQGAYAPKSSLGPLLRPWYAVAGLAAGFVALAIIAQAGEYLSLVREDRALTEQAAEICARGYSTPIVETCRTEMRQRLSAAGQSSGADEGFLSTLAAFAINAGGATRLEALNYRSDVMDLQLTVPSVTVLDEVSQQINATERFTMEIQSNTPSDAGVTSRIQIVSRAR
jgi:general secretion pathway protein L